MKRANCPTCGKVITPDEIFCNKCSTLNPSIAQYLAHASLQHPNDYTSNQFKCPHCGKKAHPFSMRLIPPQLYSPIHYCSVCNSYYLVLFFDEWSVLHPSQKKMGRLLLNRLLKNELIIHDLLEDFPPLWALTAVVYPLLHFPISFLWNRYMLKKHIPSSQQRLAVNPNYPQILADMGYGDRMDECYYPLMKFPPQKQSFKDLLKEAFTFD